MDTAIKRLSNRLYWDIVNELMYCPDCAEIHRVKDYEDNYLKNYDENSEVLICDGCGKDLSKGSYD